MVSEHPAAPSCRVRLAGRSQMPVPPGIQLLEQVDKSGWVGEEDPGDPVWHDARRPAFVFGQSMALFGWIEFGGLIVEIRKIWLGLRWVEGQG